MDRQGAFLAFGLSCGADLPAEEDDPVAEVVALLRGEDQPQLALHLFRVLALRQAQAAADADAVGVADDGAGLFMDIAQQEVRGLAPDAGDLQQLLHGPRDPAAEIRQKHLTAQHDIPGLVLVKSAGADEIFHIRNVRRRHGLQGRVGGKQGGGHQIHPGIGTLGGKPHGDHQLVILAVVQGANGVGV